VTMTTPPESANPMAAPRRRRLWPWIIGLCLAPFVVLGVAAYSYLTLDRNAAVLRQQMMASSPSAWHTKVQLSTGRLTLGVIRQGLRLVYAPKMAEARLALAAVRRASVGVYETAEPVKEIASTGLVERTDAAMQRRGWTRLVTVFDHDDKILVYVPQDDGSAETIELCVAVLDGRELVVVSTTVRAGELAALIAQHRPGDWRNEFGRVARGI
jgi:hypothetical protein